MIETLLREICLVEVVASTLIICLLEYYCLTVKFTLLSVCVCVFFYREILLFCEIL